MKKFLFLTLISLGLTACDSSKDTFNPQMKGEILTLSTAGTAYGLYVEGEASEAYEYTAASITLNNQTQLQDSNGKPLSFEDLDEGCWVEVEFEGPVAESYPVQAIAKTIRLVEND